MKARWSLAVAMLVLGLGCATRGATRPAYLVQIDDDLRVAAQAFAAGSLDGRTYLALARDRAAKAKRYHDDAAWRRAADLGDRDRDGVPDGYDRCESPHGTPTDEHGCPRAAVECPADRAECGPDAEGDRRARQVMDDVKFLVNSRCDASPTPQTPLPLRWGRGPQGSSGHGFNLAVTRVDNQQAGCQFFYEVEARIEYASPPRVVYANVLFDAAEDLKPGEPRFAVFGIPMPETIAVSPGRDRLRKIFGEARAVQWRVRAVNGANAISPWSPIRSQGPASSGVDG
jgi:hypothetical protein